MSLREYQTEAIRQSYAALRQVNTALLQMPTGAGKTHVAMEIIKHGLKKNKRITFICDRISLIDQTFNKFMENGIRAGVIQGDHPAYNISLPVQVASIQTLARREWSDADLFIVDEAHDQYEALYKQMKKWDARKWLGLSATPFTRGLGLKWQKLITTVTTRELIDQGHLSPFIAYGHTQPDLSKVRTRMGDFAINDMEAPVRSIVGSVVQHYQSMGEGRKTLGFAVNVAHAQELAAQFSASGIRANYVEGRDSPERRREVLDAFRGNGLDVLFNCEVMTKGMDIPDIGCLILARPTKSLSLHIQMCGRGLRVADGKENCLILDHAGNIERLGFPDDPLPTEMCDREKGVCEKDKKPKDEPLPWNCPQCHHLVPIKTRACPCCGYMAKPIADVTEETGVLKRLKSAGRADKQEIYSQLLCMAEDRGYAKGWVSHKYKAIFGVFPRKVSDTIAVPSPELRKWITSQNIRYANRRQA